MVKVRFRVFEKCVRVWMKGSVNVLVGRFVERLVERSGENIINLKVVRLRGSGCVELLNERFKCS